MSLNQGGNEKTIDIKLNANATMKISNDSSGFFYWKYEGSIWINIYDTTETPSSNFSLDSLGRVIHFEQNYQNRIGFDYDEKTGELIRIRYDNNKGKYKSIILK